MNRAHSLDTQPGPLPDIRANGDGVTFMMAPPGARNGDQLVIRCDAAGEVLVSIRPKTRTV
jgi:hypothetical protein